MAERKMSGPKKAAIGIGLAGATALGGYLLSKALERPQLRALVKRKLAGENLLENEIDPVTHGF